METDEGNHKNKRAGRRSVWWRFQAKPEIIEKNQKHYNSDYF